MFVAKHYVVDMQWNTYLNYHNKNGCAENYYQLLLIIKTMSKQDNVWISFIEGLHQHAAIVKCLMCSVFDLKNNFIKKGSLKRKDFRVAGVQHCKRPDMSTIQVLNEIFNNCFEATI
jgi:hypothetical protein